jgi:hypothetical protein
MIKIKYLIIGILINLLTSSCSEKFVTTEMKNNFSDEQIADLRKIRDFFESQVCNENESNFKECFAKLPHDSL